jgi:hypothetical protein
MQGWPAVLAQSSLRNLHHLAKCLCQPAYIVAFEKEQREQRNECEMYFAASQGPLGAENVYGSDQSSSSRFWRFAIGNRPYVTKRTTESGAYGVPENIIASGTCSKHDVHGAALSPCEDVKIHLNSASCEPRLCRRMESNRHSAIVDLTVHQHHSMLLVYDYSAQHFYG